MPVSTMSNFNCNPGARLETFNMSTTPIEKMKKRMATAIFFLRIGVVIRLNRFFPSITPLIILTITDKGKKNESILKVVMKSNFDDSLRKRLITMRSSINKEKAWGKCTKIL